VWEEKEPEFSTRVMAIRREQLRSPVLSYGGSYEDGGVICPESPRVNNITQKKVGKRILSTTTVAKVGQRWSVDIRKGGNLHWECKILARRGAKV